MSQPIAPIPSGSFTADVYSVLEFIVLAINVVTAAVLVWGVLYGGARFIRAEITNLSGRSCDKERADLRKQVGFYLLFALELLIAADVLQTMISPTLEHLAILAGVSFIRIVIGYALGKELSQIHSKPHPPGSSA